MLNALGEARPLLSAVLYAGSLAALSLNVKTAINYTRVKACIGLDESKRPALSHLYALLA